MFRLCGNVRACVLLTYTRMPHGTLLPADVFVASRPTTAPACVLRSKPVMRAGYDLGGSPNADVVQYRHSGGICPPEYKASAMSKPVARLWCIQAARRTWSLPFSAWSHTRRLDTCLGSVAPPWEAQHLQPSVLWHCNRPCCSECPPLPAPCM